VTQDLEIDHVVPLAVSGDDSDDNQQALCRDCHALKTAAESRSGVSSLPEWLPKPLIQIIAVCGPPGSGKSTYVRERASPADLVLDTDEIAAWATGKPIYEASAEDRDGAIRYRNTMLARLGRERDAGTYSKCWLIVTAATPRARQFWASYASKLVTLNPGTDECIRRINADDRRPAHVKRASIEGVRQWGKPSAAPYEAHGMVRAKVRIGVDGYPMQ
jgi:5-methylcytosine-specific restriction protein A